VLMQLSRPTVAPAALSKTVKDEGVKQIV
jgi:hypothetical protein